MKAQDMKDAILKECMRQLEEGKSPWIRPWLGQPSKMPFNPISKTRYGFMNACYLAMESAAIGRKDPRFATFLQISQAGYSVKRGAKATHVIAVGSYNRKEEKEEARKNGKKCVERRFLKAYPVFNGTDIEGLEPWDDTTNTSENEKVAAAERLIKGSKANILFDVTEEAYYSLTNDIIHTPVIEEYKSSADYYSTLLHELSHWTGASHRLDRDMTGNKHSGTYAQEEMIAEMSAYILTSECNIEIPEETFASHASYIVGWQANISKSPDLLFKAMSEADKAARFIIDLAEKGETK